MVSVETEQRIFRWFIVALLAFFLTALLCSHFTKDSASPKGAHVKKSKPKPLSKQDEVHAEIKRKALLKKQKKALEQSQYIWQI